MMFGAKALQTCAGLDDLLHESAELCTERGAVSVSANRF